LLDPAAPVSLAAACDLIFEPGFSSSTEVDEMSGRGFGLDVVRREIRAINGEVSLRTEPGRGTSLEIQLPITLAIIQCMLVRAGTLDFAVPVSAIAETLRYQSERVESVAQRQVVRLRGETLPLVDLRQFFGMVETDDSKPEYVVVTRSGDRPLALAVGGLMGQHEVVIKPIGRRLERIPGIAGATELAESRAALVLDVTSLTAEVHRCAGAV
jgi:two-component system chemotaxis sensor kinase CheA